MRGKLDRAFLAICFAVGGSVVCPAQSALPLPARLPAEVEQVLTWLPADTETILVANAPFKMPGFKPPDYDRQDRKTDLAEVTGMFEFLPLNRFRFKDGLLQDYLMGQTIKLAIEGSRHFRPPARLGEMRYEGCEIAVLATAAANRGDSFAKQSSKAAVRVDEVVGQKVLVFEEESENDIWSILVAFPKPNLVLVCTSGDYLREVLERIGGKTGPRALSNALTEWGFVGTDAPFWGLRHYDKSPADFDPTSPFLDRNIIGMVDKQATGIAFRYDPGNEKVVTVSYFSSTTDILGFLQKKTPLSMGVDDPGANNPALGVRYRQAAPGVAEIQYELRDALPVDAFLAIIMGTLGHFGYF